MSLFKFRVVWDDDDNISRDIEILSGQTFMDFHLFIQKSFALNKDWSASFYVINNLGKREYEINSEVEKNLRSAPALSCKRTPIGSMVTGADQEFIYAVSNPQEWDFRINLITIDRNGAPNVEYPFLLRAEGLSPMDLTTKGKSKESIVDVEERYDLPGGEEEEGSDGFGFDDEQGSDGITDTGGGESMEDF
jgi:Plasmid pRiA4b ORF-3-like protein